MYIHVYECKYMHVYGTASNPQLEYCFDSTQPVKIIVLALQYHDTSPRYSASCTAFNSFQHHYLQPNMVYTSTYKYIQCTDTVRTGMYFVHNHTSHPIGPTSHQARSALRRRRISAPRWLRSCRASSFLSAVSSTDNEYTYDIH